MDIQALKRENSEYFNDTLISASGSSFYDVSNKKFHRNQSVRGYANNYYVQAYFIDQYIDMDNHNENSTLMSIDMIGIADAVTQHQNKIFDVLANEADKWIKWVEENPEKVLLNEPEKTQFFELIDKVKKKRSGFIIMTDPKEFF